MPAGAICLATSPDCAVQAMSWGPRAYSMQFHLEVEADTVENWAAIPSYAKDLETALGKNGVEELKIACENKMSDFVPLTSISLSGKNFFQLFSILPFYEINLLLFVDNFLYVWGF